MKKVMMFLAAIAAFQSCLADNYVNGYMRRDGTYVQPHYQTQGDRNPYNNYSTQGNTNPYTGQQGYRDPVQVQQQYAPHQPSYNGGGYGNQYGNQHNRRNGW
jgi:hypothetical protein